MFKPRTLEVPCRFGERKGRFRVHLGYPSEPFHPLHFQTAWLRETRGGEIDREVFERLGEPQPKPPSQ